VIIKRVFFLAMKISFNWFILLINNKIEKYASSILDEDNKRNSSMKSKLSPEEYAYATEYFKNVKEHLTASVLGE